jgi:hypothetical protein
LWEKYSSRLVILSILREEATMSRIGIAIAILVFAVFSGILLWGMFFSYIEAVSALSALKLEFMAPIKIDVD